MMIPDWDISGVLPPILPGKEGGSPDRSPYFATFHQVVERFAVSPERVAILNGLLEYRAALHKLGLVNGFQWLDGSFIEQIEVLEDRPPKDVDVVTFFHLPSGVNQEGLFESNKELFQPKQVKAQFRVDGYPCVLGEPTDRGHVRKIAYWYSMWSHRRDWKWKGFIQIELSPAEDIVAKKVLEQISQQKGGLQ